MWQLLPTAPIHTSINNGTELWVMSPSFVFKIVKKREIAMKTGKEMGKKISRTGVRTQDLVSNKMHILHIHCE